MNYELIIFDADETLFDFKKSEKTAFEATIREFGLDYNEADHLETYKKINGTVWKELELGLITQKELNEQRFHRLIAALEQDIDPSAMAKTYTKHLARASFLYEESEELIRKLSEEHRLAIISNGLKEVQNGRLGNSIISEYFEAIIISEEVGLAKPDPAIFELLFKRIQFEDKRKALIVGDSLSSDIMGGIRFGIDTCWYHAGNPSNRTEIKPTYGIGRLKELFQILNVSQG